MVSTARLTPARHQTEGILQKQWRTCVAGAPMGRKTPARKQVKSDGGDQGSTESS